jgi:hypothetical protein
MTGLFVEPYERMVDDLGAAQRIEGLPADARLRLGPWPNIDQRNEKGRNVMNNDGDNDPVLSGAFVVRLLRR